MPDYIPARDAAFNTWQGNFLNYLVANFAKMGLAPEDFASVVTAQTAWEADFANHVAQRQAALGARQAKVGSRKTLVEVVRAFVRQLQANPLVSDDHRAGLGITVPDPDRSPLAGPTSKPIVIVDTSNRLQHSLRFIDEESPTSRARPAGTIGIEVWAKIGMVPPSDPSELDFMEMATSAPVMLSFTGEQAGQSVHYMCRWLGTRGQPGPWSETATATVGA